MHLFRFVLKNALEAQISVFGRQPFRGSREKSIEDMNLILSVTYSPRFALPP
eukprot:UN21820